MAACRDAQHRHDLDPGSCRATGDALEATGVAVWLEGNAQELANHFIRPSLWTIPRLLGISAPIDHEIFDELAVRMDEARGPHPDLLISSQEFCMMRDALEAYVLKSTLRQVFDRVVPIVAFRGDRQVIALRRTVM